ncbi:MAG: hypothetical protein ACI4ET_12750 [Bilifractor sp.]
MSTQNIITVDDGTRKYEIQNKFGRKICDVFIRPGDLSILNRYEEVIKALPEIVEPLKTISIKSDGTAEDDAEWNAIRTAQAELEKQLNFLFDMDEAQDIFKNRNPFSSVQGRFFCEIVIDAIGNIITQVVKEETDNMKARTKAYTDDLDGAEEEVNADAGEPTDKA